MPTVDVPQNLIGVGQWFGPGYKPVLDFQGWRVAMLRYGEFAAPNQLHRVERHNATNEVFILTAGRADLIVMDGDVSPTDAFVFPMRLNVAYNIQQSVWHHVVMTEDAHIVLFERTDTSVTNSDYAELPVDAANEIRRRLTVAS